MSLGYRAVGWNRQKRLYDRTILGGVLLYLLLFLGIGGLLNPNATAETLVIRAFGTGAFLLLHLILAIGPLCRLDRRFLPLLYNRRHLGVSMFLMALVHGGFSLVQFHALGDTPVLESLFTANTRYSSLAWFPFQPLGFAALGILFLMAATSHDFWLANLGAPVWKALHMAVYLAYALLVGHVVLGVLQAETSPLLAVPVAAGLAGLLVLHLAAGWRERRLDRQAPAREDLVDVGAVGEIAEGRARIATVGTDRVAVFRHEGELFALENACRHQNGPLGEGRIVDGCITCPWHGYQYRPRDGCSPPPFTEKVRTFDVRVAEGRVLVDRRAHPPGTPARPARIEAPAPRAGSDEFYVGYLDAAPPGLAVRTRRTAVLLLASAAAVGTTLALGFRRLPPSRFEYGTVREFEGTLAERPYPALLVDRPGSVPELAGTSRYHLVAAGKHGAASEVAGRDGERARLEGTLVYRDGQTMIELDPGSLRAGAGSPTAPSAPVPLGTHRLIGEIVDSKCFLGVMNPGNLKPHRACAARCISGGIPPVLCVRDRGGDALYLLLVDGEGAPVNDRVLGLVAEPVEIEGEVSRIGDQLVLRADPSGYRRL